MDSRLNRTIDGFIDIVGQIGAGLGLSKVASQLYALLFMSSNPVSLDEMVARLGVSKGNISINIRALENWGAVRKVWVKGENRKDYYVAEMDTFKIVVEQLKLGLSRRLDEVMAAIKSVEEVMPANSKKLSEEDRKAMRDYSARMGRAKQMIVKLKGLLKATSGLSRIIGSLG